MEVEVIGRLQALSARLKELNEVLEEVERMLGKRIPVPAIHANKQIEAKMNVKVELEKTPVPPPVRSLLSTKLPQAFLLRKVVIDADYMMIKYDNSKTVIDFRKVGDGAEITVEDFLVLSVLPEEAWAKIMEEAEKNVKELKEALEYLRRLVTAVQVVA